MNENRTLPKIAQTIRPNIRLIIYDFDGVLTDNRVWVSEDGKEAVACNRSDGWWIGEIRRLPIEQVILSTERNPVVAARGKKIGLEVCQGQEDKKAALLALANAREVDLQQVVYVGNEMNDYESMKIVGFPLAPCDSHPEILKLATWIIPVAGGKGIVRHLFDWLTHA